MSPRRRPPSVWDGLRLVVVDTETTGLTSTSRVVSFAVVDVEDGRTGNSTAWLVNPEVGRIPTTHIHGLTVERLAKALPFRKIAAEVELRLTSDEGRTVLTGFNVAFDARMLHGEMSRLGKRLPPLDLLDLRPLAARAGVAPTGGKLEDLLTALGIVNPAAHTELGDALATATAAIALLNRLDAAGVTNVEELLVPFDAAALGTPSRRPRDFDTQEVTEEHARAHHADLTDPATRDASLDTCLAEGCADLAYRMEDAITSKREATAIAHWALGHATSGTLDRRRLGRLLGGLGRAVRRSADPTLAQQIYEALLPVLAAAGPCTPYDRCGRCQHTTRTCRFDQVRYRLLDAYLHTAPEQGRYPDIKQAETFLHMPKVSGRGQPRRCWFHELVEAGELDAAGYGAVLCATARRRTGDRDWALRTLERAWKHGSRNAELADNYASMLITDRRVRTRSNLKLALDVLDEALALQQGRRGRIYEDLAARRERVQKLLNAPVQAKPKRTVNKRPPRNSRMLLD